MAAVSFQHTKYVSSSIKEIVNLYITHLQRVYSILNVPSLIMHVCILYYNEKTEYFAKKGIRCKLNMTNSLCKLEHNGGSTVYGNFNVNNKISIVSWTFKIISKKLNIFIGIDSNPIFTHCDFSNFYRSFNTKRKDIFCAYGSDGNLYDYLSVAAEEYAKPFKNNDIIKMTVNVKEEYLEFYKNNESQGIALDDMNFDDKEYHMAVALFYADDAIELIDFDVVINDDDDDDKEI